FGAQYAGEKFPLIFSVEDAERKMDQLRLVEKQDKVVLPYRGMFDLIPFQRHAFPRVDLHDNLLTAYLIGESLEEHLPLLQLRYSVKLNPPEQHIEAKARKRSNEPPYTGCPDIPKAYGKCD